MKHLVKFAILSATAITVAACQNRSNSIFGKPNSPFVDSLHFKSSDVADAANDIDGFTAEALKADKEINSNSPADSAALVKKMHDEMLEVKAKMDSASSKIGAGLYKMSNQKASFDSTGMNEYFKWEKFLAVEGKKLSKVKHKSLRF